MTEDLLSNDIKDYMWYEQKFEEIADLWNYTPSVFAINKEYVEKMDRLKEQMEELEVRWGKDRIERGVNKWLKMKENA